MAPTQRELPSREATQFKGLLKFFEHRQYKRGLKSAEQILKKAPEHGETLAMKGLFLSNLDRKGEGYDFVRKGLRVDLTSHICWHVYGLLYRADKNYEEAIKCYRNALKFDKNNMQILRDLALLQVQMRDYEGYAETRELILQLNSHNRMFWLGYAVSLHLLKEYDLAASVLKTYEDSMKLLPPKNDYDHSELLLYRNFIIEDSGDHERALADLESISDRVCDVVAVREKRAELLQKLGRASAARAVYRSLIKENPNQRSYLKSYIESHGFPIDTTDAKQDEAIAAVCEQLADEVPKSALLKRMSLDYRHGDVFRSSVSGYMKTMLRKGVPSLFASFKPLYADAARTAIIQEVALGFYHSLSESQTLEDDADAAVELPTTLLWTIYFLAQHFDKLGDYEKAMEFINQGIKHTPTLVELHMTKARILKHMGDLDAAARTMNDARSLDLQDRFVNSKCTKYYLRNNQLNVATTTIGLFTRPDVKDPIKDLVDMQCLWFAQEAGYSHIRQGQRSQALKCFHQIGKHFDDFVDDQFDFHTYCLRKTTLRSYIKLIRFEDTLYSDPVYVSTAEAAIRCYIDLFDHPEGKASASRSADPDAVDTSTMSPSELKKYMSKLRKQQARSKQQSNGASAPTTDKAKKDATKAEVADIDKAVDHAATEDPLGEASKWLVILQQYASELCSTHVLGFEVAIRKRKYLLALQCLKKVQAIDPGHPELVQQIVRLSEQVGAGESLSEAVRTVLVEKLGELLGDQAPVKFISNQLEQHQASAKHVAAAIRACSFLSKKQDQDAALRTIESAITEHMTHWTRPELEAMLRAASGAPMHDAIRLKLTQHARKQFPSATAFKTLP